MHGLQSGDAENKAEVETVAHFAVMPAVSHTDLTEEDSSTNGLQGLLQVSQTVLHQAMQVCDSLTSDDQLIYESKLMPGSTIGNIFACAYCISNFTC